MAYQSPINGKRISLKADANSPIETGIVTLASGSNITLSQSSGTITVSSTAGNGGGTYDTSNTSSTDSGKYTRLGVATIAAQYEDSRSVIMIVSKGDGWDPGSRATVDFRVKQQNAMGSAPVVDVRVTDTDSQYISNLDFTAVTTTNSVSSTVVELWVRIGASYMDLSFTPLINTGSKPVAWQSSQAFSASLPGGTQTPAYAAGSTMTGEIKMWATGSAPYGWLACDGSAISRTTYATLFAVLGTTYGTGDGSTTFNLPNMKGRVPVGYDSGQTEFNTLGKTGGEKTHLLTQAEMPSHTHTDSGHTHGAPNGSFWTGSGTANVANGTFWGVHVFDSSVTATLSGTANLQNTGGGGAHNNLQPYITLNYIIKT